MKSRTSEADEQGGEHSRSRNNCYFVLLVFRPRNDCELPVSFWRSWCWYCGTLMLLTDCRWWLIPCDFRLWPGNDQAPVEVLLAKFQNLLLVWKAIVEAPVQQCTLSWEGSRLRSSGALHWEGPRLRFSRARWAGQTQMGQSCRLKVSTLSWEELRSSGKVQIEVYRHTEPQAAVVAKNASRTGMMTNFSSNFHEKLRPPGGAPGWSYLLSGKGN